MHTDVTADVVRLGRLQSAYADVVNRRAWSELTRLFRPGCTLSLDTVTSAPRTIIGPHDIGSFIEASIERFDHFEFVILNSVFDVDGDGADGRMFMAEIRHDSTADEWSTAYGLYRDRYTRMEDQWWFDRRDYRSLARRGPGEAVFGVPPGLPPMGQVPNR